MRLDKNTGPVSKWRIAGREARATVKVSNTLVQVTIVNELQVPRDHVSASFSRRADPFINHFFFPGQHARGNAGMMLMLVSNVVLIISAVSHVTVNKKIGLPLVPQR